MDNIGPANDDAFVWQDEARQHQEGQGEDANARKRRHLWERYRERYA